MSYIESFLKIFEELKNLTSNYKIEETEENIKVTFSAKMNEFISFAQNSWVIKDVDTKCYHIFVKYQDRTVSFKDLSIKTFDIEIPSTLTVRFNKKEKIYKDNNNIMLYFDLDSFIKLLKDRVYNFFVEDTHEKFLFIPINNYYFNGNLHISPLKDYDNSKNYHVKAKETNINKIEAIKTISYNHGFIEDFPTPLVFRFNEIQEEELSHVFHYAQVFTICNYLANRVDSDKLIFKGYQSIELKINEYFIPKNPRSFSRLFDFVFDEDKYTDKVEITRNVLSLYLSDHSTLQNLDELMHKVRITIEDHFGAYIQDKIKKFFDQRKDLVKEAYSSATEAKETSDKIIASINLLILGLVTASLTAIFAYSKGDRLIFLLALIFHTLYFLISFIVNFINLKGKGDIIEKSFQDYVDEFSILKEQEVKKIKSTYLKPAIKRLRSSFKWYIGISIFLIIVMVITSIIVWKFGIDPASVNKIQKTTK
ncbi:hypothetical protein [Priestia megaterium]|uniref:hypothetical protein n=1 Tax=Priestia megaterium TaxID=1404 RepID=UPI0012B728A3|nr:hypothetical protein [Priestia megaterium]